MTKDLDPQTECPPGDTAVKAASASLKAAAPKTKASTTRKKPAVSGPVYKSTPSPQHHFFAEVRTRSPHNLAMIARDPFHHLHCELPLAFQETQQGKKKRLSLVCQFPTIGDCALVDLIEEDEDLLGFIMICFYVHILENLFLFCAAQKANTLVIQTMEADFQGAQIYEGFAKSVKKTQSRKGVTLEMAIPLRARSLRDCRAFMGDVMEQFRKILWHDQTTNSAIRNYVIHNLRLSVVASKQNRKETGQ